jgi:hypothetical protein
MRLLSELALLAADNGEGLVGETDDRIITFFSLGVVAFFAIAVILLSALQARLDRRKEERKAAELRRRVGWEQSPETDAAPPERGRLLRGGDLHRPCSPRSLASV